MHSPKMRSFIQTACRYAPSRFCLSSLRAHLRCSLLEPAILKDQVLGSIDVGIGTPQWCLACALRYWSLHCLSRGIDWNLHCLGRGIERCVALKHSINLNLTPACQRGYRYSNSKRDRYLIAIWCGGCINSRVWLLQTKLTDLLQRRQ